MPSDPFTFTFTFTPLRVLGAPHYKWRVFRTAGQYLVQRQLEGEGAWRFVSAKEWGEEISYGTEVAAWLSQLKAAGMIG